MLVTLSLSLHFHFISLHFLLFILSPSPLFSLLYPNLHPFSPFFISALHPFFFPPLSIIPISLRHSSFPYLLFSSLLFVPTPSLPLSFLLFVPIPSIFSPSFPTFSTLLLSLFLSSSSLSQPFLFSVLFSLHPLPFPSLPFSSHLFAHILTFQFLPLLFISIPPLFSLFSSLFPPLQFSFLFTIIIPSPFFSSPSPS